MKKLNVTFIIIIAIILAVFPVATLLSDKESYSVYENRTLEPTPVLSVQTVFDGSFFGSAETYLKDHIAGRDTLLCGYTAISKYLLSKPNVSDVVDTGDSLLPYIPSTYTEHADSADIETAADAVCIISKQMKGNLAYIGVPSQSTRFADEYPDYLSYIPRYIKNTADLFKASLAERGVDFIEGSEFLTKDMYFKTDHHFDITGGYAVYQAICDYAGVEAVPWEKFELKTYESEIYGSRNRKIYKLSQLSDKISYYETDIDIPFERYDNGKKADSTVFKMPTEGEVPSYGIYMGGDNPETVIKTNRPDLPDVLIYGDSYTNAVECFAYMSFDETRYLDLRYYDEMSLEEYIERYQPDYVFCIRDDRMYTDCTDNGGMKK